MIDRDWLGQVQGFWITIRDSARSRTTRLEAWIFVLLLMLRATVALIDALSSFYDDAEIQGLINAAGDTAPLETDGTLTKRSIQKYIAMLAGFRTWATTNISGVSPAITPRKLLVVQPERVAPVQSQLP